ncbi:SDR family NAD(P)-dependent oxidoreductase [Candidatus Saccharibacteria bacterium]|nr:SDR family NAD(P)-dependent oxidoreductase [Candidatus Saccharibacteria bacterium]
MNTLIMGGTSGLGLELARLESENNQVIVAGRHDPALDGDGTAVDFTNGFRAIDLANEPLAQKVKELVATLPEVEHLVYAAGFYQEGHIDDIGIDDIEDMLNVGLRGLIYTVKKVIERQDELPELTVITSTSQWTPREFEQVYTAVKAGAAQFANSMSLDPRVGKTLVAAPSGMATPFWDKDGRDTSHMMQPEWVAEQIQQLRNGESPLLVVTNAEGEPELKADYSYCFAKILGAKDELPQRVIIEEIR